MAKTKNLSPRMYNNFNLSDDKRVKSDIFNSYMKYKKILFSNNFQKAIQCFINPFSFLKKNSSSNLLLSKRNYYNNIQKREFTHIKEKTIKNKNKRKIKCYLRNNTIDNENKREDGENKFKSKYKYLMRNLSFNGNSRVQFKNLSNEILDNLFKNKPYNSFNIVKTQKTIKKEREKRRIKYKYENILNRINSSIFLGKENYNNNIKESNEINYLKSKNIIRKKISDFNKETQKLNFENQAIKNESKELFNSLIYQKKKLFLKSKKSLRTNYGIKFKTLKMKLRKQNDVNSNLINNIRKEQSLSKYKLQVGIVKLNGYRPKIRRKKYK